MTHASLFSGIGGFDMAARWVGWKNLFNCEIDSFCQTVLKYHFPDAKQYSDIRATDFTPWRERIDVLTGGFPCQPFSVAGKRKGTEDERHLWPEMLRAIQQIQPRWVVGENVLGIISWSKGLVFEQVCADLEAEGYEVQTFILPACGVGAPHRRYRTWFVAHSNGNRHGVGENQQEPIAGSYTTTKHRADGITWTTADADNFRPQAGVFSCGTDPLGRQIQNRLAAMHPCYDFRTLHTTVWKDFPTQSPVCSRDDGVSARLDSAAVFIGISKPRKPLTFPKWRAESIKAYGNAIVPQVVFQIFKTINQYHT